MASRTSNGDVKVILVRIDAMRESIEEMKVNLKEHLNDSRTSHQKFYEMREQNDAEIRGVDARVEKHLSNHTLVYVIMGAMATLITIVVVAGPTIIKALS